MASVQETMKSSELSNDFTYTLYARRWLVLVAFCMFTYLQIGFYPIKFHKCPRLRLVFSHYEDKCSIF